MINSLEFSTVAHSGYRRETQLERRRNASRLFAAARKQGKRRTLWRWLSGRSNRLQGVPTRNGRSRSRAPRPAVVHVPLDKIVGSEGRTRDFDSAFNPRVDHIRDRWIGIAAARHAGIELPPIELIQVGDRFYVRDGHHRISVARAAGQAEIEAQIVWMAETH